MFDKDLNMLRRYVNLNPETGAMKFERMEFSTPDADSIGK
jgi:hypothetical protein